MPGPNGQFLRPSLATGLQLNHLHDTQPAGHAAGDGTGLKETARRPRPLSDGPDSQAVSATTAALGTKSSWKEVLSEALGENGLSGTEAARQHQKMKMAEKSS